MPAGRRRNIGRNQSIQYYRRRQRAAAAKRASDRNEGRYAPLPSAKQVLDRKQSAKGERLLRTPSLSLTVQMQYLPACEDCVIGVVQDKGSDSYRLSIGAQ